MGSQDSFIQIMESGTSKSGKTLIFDVIEGQGSWPNDSVLGHIKWHGPWRKYVFFPARDTLFEEKCMGEISDFIKDATDQHFGRGPYREVD